MEMGRALYVCFMPFIVQNIIDEYGWRWGLRFLSVMPLIMVPFMYYMGVIPDERPLEVEKGDEKEQEKIDLDDRSKNQNPEQTSLPGAQEQQTQAEAPPPEKMCGCIPKPPQSPAAQEELTLPQKKLVRIVCIGVLCSFLAFASGRTLFVTYADQKFGKIEQFNSTTNQTIVIRESVMSASQRASLVSFFNFSSVGIRVIIIFLKDLIIRKKIRAADMWFFGSIGCIISFGTTPVMANTFGPNGLVMAAVFQGLTLGIYQGQPITVLANIVGVARLRKWMVVYTLLCGLGNFFGPISIGLGVSGGL